VALWLVFKRSHCRLLCSFVENETEIFDRLLFVIHNSNEVANLMSLGK